MRVEKRGMLGYPYWYNDTGMPRIQDDFLDCVVYLYPTAIDAKSGVAAGGTGFLAGVPSAKLKGRSFLYAVTNSHVIREGNSPIVRLNTLDGATDVLPLEPDNWVHHPDGDDVAVCSIGLSDKYYKFKVVGQKMFLTKDLVAEHNFGPGDDVFFLGRFMTHEGKQQNLPSARFGNIAMMPWEAVHSSKRGIDQESFLVEARSLSGYSGSPVFVYIPPLAPRPGKGLTSERYGPFLLGIDWCHLATFEEVLEDDKETPVPERWYVRSHSGMMAVVPAWKLQEILNLEGLVKERQEFENKELAEQKKKRGAAVLDSPKAEGVTKEEFEEAGR